ncbi:hypothetical protein PF004_g24009 [Phytophthora fragariae]|uniref:Reverse transcriptase domain-containing protein n=2 Tax=Phytophthora fragariae TaxID=53985 RepID=A0A6G0MVF3_9STRA|nr:hypothetical protein PF004_g24009 [Phytophthora fragariae]
MQRLVPGFAEALTPLLTRLFNQWYDNGVFPASFLEADIFCLKKGGDQSNPLNYRPLALLNFDYKLFTRVLATRTSPTLASIIHPNQAGFVPGRQLHDTVDLYSAAKVTAESDPSQQDALAMLLDFAKAYDSLARLFLMMVLAWLGYPAKFIKTLDFLHSGTTIRFLVNGLKSRPVAVTCGIRQGCPLAPLLFILALEPFCRLIELAAGISGVCLVTACTSVILKVAGYADDTAVYLGTPAEVPSLLDISARFGAASGLWVNARKTVIIALCSSVPTAEIVLPSPLAVHGKTEYCRYLGAQIGGQEIVSFTWLKAAGQLTFRLRLASLKTLTQDQRSTLAAAIIIPKLLHIARHAWPTLYWVGELQRGIRNFVWHGQFVPSGTNGSHWINTDIAALPRASGGLAVPDLKAELLAFAATEVTRWALTSNTTMRAVGDILQRLHLVTAHLI